jgi:AraC-like DNA-binding protein
MAYDALHWEMFLRGCVAGLLLFHLAALGLPGPRPALRAALALFVASVLAYLFCQQAEIALGLPRPLTLPLIALCVGSPAWMWLAARALFDDHFRFEARLLAPALGMVALGLAANLPYLPELQGRLSPEAVRWLGRLHGAGLLGFAALALWEVARGRADDLVEPRRAARRWVVLGIAAYALLALVVELALHGERVGRLLPMLHVGGIGALALGLALLVARGSLVEVLGTQAAPPPEPPEPAAPAETSAPAEPAPARKPHPALARLEQAMQAQHLYRREGLSLAALAAELGLGEAALRSLINHELGYRNFNDFLHHHRLQEACRRLVDEDLPVLSIALECGYGSIGPFNRAFRERMGMTPTEYRGAARLGPSPPPAAAATTN